MCDKMGNIGKLTKLKIFFLKKKTSGTLVGIQIELTHNLKGSVDIFR